MIEVHLTQDEIKVIAYTYGYVSRAAGDGSQATSEAAPQLHAIASQATTWASAPQEVEFEEVAAYAIATSMHAARMDWEADFLDWRVLRGRAPGAVITTFRPLSEVWTTLFGNMLQNPDSVVLALHAYRRAWESARLNLLRSIGRHDPSILRSAITGADTRRQEVEGLYKERLLARKQELLSRRQEALETFVESVAFQVGATCLTCSAPLTGEFFCRACAELFFDIRQLDRGSPVFRDTLLMIGRDQLVLMGQALIAWVYWNGTSHQDQPCVCKRCSCGAPRSAEQTPCDTCGFVHGVITDDAFETLILFQRARAHRIAYNLAIGNPPFRAYGVRDLTSEREQLAADGRRREEQELAFRELREAAEALNEIYDMAGFDEVTQQ